MPELEVSFSMLIRLHDHCEGKRLRQVHRKGHFVFKYCGERRATVRTGRKFEKILGLQSNEMDPRSTAFSRSSLMPSQRVWTMNVVGYSNVR